MSISTIRQKTGFLGKYDSKRVNLSLIIIIIIISFTVYFNALFNDFVFDDVQNVLENHWIRNIRYIPEIFSSHMVGFDKTSYYRPMMSMIYMINYHIFGLNPWGFHLVNIIFHSGVSVLVFLIALKLLEMSSAKLSIVCLSTPFIASILFATHPIHTESVTWVAGIMDLSFTFFYLLSFYLYIKSEIGMSYNLLFSAVSFFFATLCKETAITLPLILIIYDNIFKKVKSKIHEYLKRYVFYLFVMTLYTAMRFYALRGFSNFKGHTELSIYEYFINIFPNFIQYLEKLLFPINLNLFYVFHPIKSIFEIKVIISFILIILFFALYYVLIKVNKMASFCLSFIVVALLPALYIRALLGGIAFAERYLYLPSFGFVMLLALFIDWVSFNKPKNRITYTIILFVLIGIFSFKVICRNVIWKNEYNLWADTVKKSPDGAFPQAFFGYVLYVQGKTEEAIEHLQLAIKLKPDLVDAHTNLGVVYCSKWQFDKAIEHYLIALSLNPDSAEVHNNLGFAYKAQGLIYNAIEEFETALRLKPNFADAHNNIGIVFMEKGLIDKGIEEFKAAVRLSPNKAIYYENLSKGYEIKNSIKNNKNKNNLYSE